MTQASYFNATFTGSHFFVSDYQSLGKNVLKNIQIYLQISK